jgi:hypothetical protein
MDIALWNFESNDVYLILDENERKSIEEHSYQVEILDLK